MKTLTVKLFVFLCVVALSFLSQQAFGLIGNWIVEASPKAILAFLVGTLFATLATALIFGDEKTNAKNALSDNPSALRNLENTHILFVVFALFQMVWLWSAPYNNFLDILVSGFVLFANFALGYFAAIVVTRFIRKAGENTVEADELATRTPLE